ncbi:MAG: RNA polymerase sigma factor SigM [Nocardiopsaceae bacterium]|nr:RNA polymerase sigma factor SigM [Nocardiopsaceae bacterium]
MRERPPDAGPSDEELLRRHLAGDPEAFGELFRRHKDRLWAVALRTTGDSEEAADALQDAMISAFRRAGDFRGRSAVTTWLHRIVVNAALDRLRRRSGRSVNWSGDEDALDALASNGGAAGSGSAAAASGPSGSPGGGEAESVETRLEVDAALRTLPPQQRAALVLVDMLGYPVSEVAEILDVSVGTVKSRCARGRARLLPHLSHLRDQPPDTAQPRDAPAPRGDPANTLTPRLSSGQGNRHGRGNVSSGQEGDA